MWISAREVFQTYKNEIEFRPKETVFVQTDVREFSISVKPADGIKVIPVFWRFLCEDYQKEGVLIINVEPSIEEKVKVITVHDSSHLRPEEVKVIPKIIEQ